MEMDSPRFAALALDSSPIRRPGSVLILRWLTISGRCCGLGFFMKTGFLSGFVSEPPFRDTILKSCDIRALNAFEPGLLLDCPSLLVPNDDDIEQYTRSISRIVLLTLHFQSLLPVLIHYVTSALVIPRAVFTPYTLHDSWAQQSLRESVFVSSVSA